MKTALIFSPFCVPSYIPLGISQLKSYIEKHVPNSRVHNLDLNNKFFNGLADADFLECCKGLCRICPKRFEDCVKKKDIPTMSKLYKIGLDCLMDSQANEFYNPIKYNYFIEKIHTFFVFWRDCLSIIARDIISNDNQIPVSLEEFFVGDIDELRAIKPDIIGFSVWGQTQLDYSLLLSRIIKKKLSTPIIFGGAFINYIDIYAFLKIFDFIDFIIDKEGEIALTEFLKLYKNKDFSKIPGLFYRKADKILKNENMFIEDLDKLPIPDFSDFDLNRYFLVKPVIPIKFSRGCFWGKCSFCDYHKTYPVGYKAKTIKKFIEEIKYYFSLGIRYFFIDDDAISAVNLVKISRMLIKNRLGIFFGAIVRPERTFSYAILKAIYTAGGRVFVWGVESSCQNVLDIMNKGTAISDIKDMLMNSHKLGFHNHVFMIKGFPKQTENETYVDLKFLLNNKNSINSFYIHDFVLSKDSHIFSIPREFGIKNIKETILYRIKKRKLTIYSNVASFDRNYKFDTAKVNSRQLEILNSLHRGIGWKFLPYEYAHILLHASQEKDCVMR